MAHTLQGRTAVVTGAGTGIGREIALRLVALGMDVAGIGRRPGPLAETAARAGEIAAAEASGGASGPFPPTCAIPGRRRARPPPPATPPRSWSTTPGWPNTPRSTS